MKKALFYLISFTAGIFLIWFTYQKQDIGNLFTEIAESEYQFILLSFMAMIVSHVARAYRWNLLYKTLGYSPGTFRTFLAVMFGYFMNLAIPRAGEISRCAILKRTDKIPLEESIGTVVAERAFDLLITLLIVGLAFSFNYDLFNQILSLTDSGESTDGGSSHILLWVAGTGMVGLVILFLFRERLMRNPLAMKIGATLQKVWIGVLSIKKVENKFMFILSTFLIWLMYFMASYVVFFALPATSELGLDAALTLLIVSTMAMIIPVPGGLAYPLFVTTALGLYGLTEADGSVYATVMYGSTVLMIFILGAISFFAAVWLGNKSK